jgi:regulator of replication initiation timing
MYWKFWSAGKMICSRQIFFIFLILISFSSCRQNQTEKDSQIAQLQKEVNRLSEENQRLTNEVQALRIQVQTKQTIPAATETAKREPSVESMTVEQMKKEIAPILKDAIEKIKLSSESPRNGKQFGMRVEYDLKNAVYGLVKNEDESAPYSAKVIVKFEKFLESNNVSRSYGNGSSTFVFAYRNKQWILQSYE